MKIVTGWYVCKWTGSAGRYTIVAWFRDRADAEAEVWRIRKIGAWSGMPPVIEASLSRRF
jgi:hypothetical protein